MNNAHTVSELTRRLDPYLVKRIQEIVTSNLTVGGSGGGGSGGLVTAHALNDTDIHTGQLDRSQALWVATDINGAITTHSAIPDAHHDPVTLATPSGLTLSGQQMALADSVAGGGLTVSAKVLAVGTPSTLSATSTNLVNADSHFHAVSASSNPGAAAQLLKSTSSGGLTLQTATVQGNVDITSGGDLTVGANILFVDASGTNVGINCAPDPQFDLDVGGNLRAQGWIVGKHAIQVKDATMIVHFDAGDGEKISTEGEPTGHFGQPALTVGDVLYGPGKFGGKSVQIMQSFTPIVTYTFETDTEGFSIVSNTTSLAQSASHAIHGDNSLRMEGAGSASGYVQSGYVTVSSNTAYSASVYWRSEYDVQLVITEYNSSNVLINTRSAGQFTPDGWERQTITWTTAAACVKVKFNFYHYNLPTGSYAYADAGQLIQSAYSLPFTDQASHTNDYPYYVAAGVINPPKGTVMMWVKPDAIDGTAQYAFTTGTDGSSTRIHIYINSSGNWTVAVGATTPTGTETVTAQAWTHVALTWDGATAVLYINGAAVQSFGYSGMVMTPATYLRVGNNAASSAPFNGWIDELGILKRAAPASEILAIFESDAPIFAETSVFSFRVGSSLVWGDDEGLWTRTTLGTAAFAVVGVDGKSWGGLTLDAGDVLVGDSSRGGYVQWDDSAASLLVSGAIEISEASNFAGSGYLQIGTGTKDSTLDGWNFAAGEIVGQENGVDQVVLSATDGTVRAGDTVLRASGIDLEGDTAPLSTQSRSINWWLDVDNPTGDPVSSVYNYVDGTVFLSQNAVLQGKGDATNIYGYAWLRGESYSGSSVGYFIVNSSQYLITNSKFFLDAAAPTLGSNWSYHSGKNLSARVFANLVEITGVIDAGGSPSTTLATLSAAYRPVSAREMPVVRVSGGSSSARLVTINTSGAIVATDWTPLSGDVVYFQIIYFL